MDKGSADAVREAYLILRDLIEDERTEELVLELSTEKMVLILELCNMFNMTPSELVETAVDEYVVVIGLDVNFVDGCKE